jgi:hypothetical protein
MIMCISIPIRGRKFCFARLVERLPKTPQVELESRPENRAGRTRVQRHTLSHILLFGKCPDDH